MSMANVTLVGKLGAAPETFYTQGGMLIVTLSVATTKYKKGQDGQGQEVTLWHTVKVFSKTAERCEKYLQKGSGVVIEGELSYRDYETSDGQKRKATEIIANRVHFTSKIKTNDNSNFQPKPSTASDTSVGYTNFEDINF